MVQTQRYQKSLGLDSDRKRQELQKEGDKEYKTRSEEKPLTQNQDLSKKASDLSVVPKEIVSTEEERASFKEASAHWEKRMPK